MNFVKEEDYLSILRLLEPREFQYFYGQLSEYTKYSPVFAMALCRVHGEVTKALQKESKLARSGCMKPQEEWMKTIPNLGTATPIFGMARQRKWLQDKLDDARVKEREMLQTIDTYKINYAELEKDLDRDYLSEKDKNEGLYRKGLLILFYGQPSWFKNSAAYQIFGSWDNWTTGYSLQSFQRNEETVFFIQLSHEIKLGKYTFKLKENEKWLDIRDEHLFQKDEKGNLNYVVFVHSP